MRLLKAIISILKEFKHIFGLMLNVYLVEAETDTNDVLRAPSHGKFLPGVKFSISTRVEKQFMSHVSLLQERNEYFF